MILCLLALAPFTVSAEDGVGNKVVFRCLGDFVIHMPLVEAAKTADGNYDFRPMLSPVADLIGDADFTVANVDGVMGANTEYSGYPRFSTPAALLDALQEYGVDMLTMSNNHTLDCDYEGLVKQMDLCDARGMDYIGAARNQQEHDAPQIREINGIRIGFLNYTANANGRDEAKANREHAAYAIHLAYESNFYDDAQALRDAGAEVIVAFMHWGKEYERTAGSEEKILASRLVAAGVDVIVGGHQHVIQRIYWLEGERKADGAPQRTLCCYSMGNFLTNQQLVYQNCGIIFEFTLEKDENGKVAVHSPGYIPVFVWREPVKDGYTYQVLPSERALEKAPEGMDQAAYARMRFSYTRTIEHLSTSASAAECIHIQ